jgi:hypothetical protein
LPPLTPIHVSQSSSSTDKNRNQPQKPKRYVLAYVSVPPLPPNVHQRDYSGPTIPKAKTPGRRGRPRKSQIPTARFATVGEALASALQNNGKSYVLSNASASGSGALKRKYSRQGKREDHDEWVPEKKRRRPSVTTDKPKVEHLERSPTPSLPNHHDPDPDPISFSGECLYSFDLDMYDIPVPQYAVLTCSLRHLMTPEQSRLCQAKLAERGNVFDILSTPSFGKPRLRSVFPTLDTEDEDEIQLESELEPEEAVLAGKQRGRPKNKEKRIWAVGSISPSGNYISSDYDEKRATSTRHRPDSRVNKGKGKAAERGAMPSTPRSRAPKSQSWNINVVSPHMDLDMDQYFFGLGDQPTISPSVSPSKRMDNLDLSAIKSTSHTHIDTFSSLHGNSTLPTTTSTRTDRRSNDATRIPGTSGTYASDHDCASDLSRLAPAHSGTHHLSHNVDDVDILYESSTSDLWSLPGDSDRSDTNSRGSTIEYVGDGTIDPSLLGGGGQTQEKSPSPSVSRSPSPPRLQRHSARNSRPAKTTVSQRAPDSSDLPTTSRPSSQRTFRPRARPGYVPVDDLDLSSSDSDESDLFVPPPSPPKEPKEPTKAKVQTSNTSSKAVPDESLMQEEFTFCHQCRRKTYRKKMQCSSDQNPDKPCRKLYCWGCIERYCLNCLARRLVLTDVFLPFFPSFDSVQVPGNRFRC